MNPLMWHKVAAISGMAALGLGTYGAHGFKPNNPSYKEVWNTTCLYHLVHTAAMVGAPITKNPNILGGLLSTGIIAFSGTTPPGFNRSPPERSTERRYRREGDKGLAGCSRSPSGSSESPQRSPQDQKNVGCSTVIPATTAIPIQSAAAPATGSSIPSTGLARD
ncbi:hypothetical protein L2E82_19608 [Cichorium intybus]|uniref:Uncharacterized protein n=1 Tax=Cichorium intybus TaxID=13427 RepID=A0ACB9FD32_CICIN|nr:hypothetical protein L2E82_19608 [Cichorium intybus]